MTDKEIKIQALRDFYEKVKDINTVLWTDLDRGRYVRVGTLVEDEIARLEA